MLSAGAGFPQFRALLAPRRVFRLCPLRPCNQKTHFPIVVELLRKTTRRYRGAGRLHNLLAPRVAGKRASRKFLRPAGRMQEMQIALSRRPTRARRAEA